MNSLPVVLIEPDYLVRNSIESMLNSLDYEVRVFSSFASFFDFAVETDFQFAILIADGPEMSPENQIVTKVLERINPAARVILMSNGATSVVETTDQKFACVLSKPFRICQLSEALKLGQSGAAGDAGAV